MTSPLHQSAWVQATCADDGSVALAYAEDESGNVLPDLTESESPNPIVAHEDSIVVHEASQRM